MVNANSTFVAVGLLSVALKLWSSCSVQARKEGTKLCSESLIISTRSRSGGCQYPPQALWPSRDESSRKEWKIVNEVMHLEMPSLCDSCTLAPNPKPSDWSEALPRILSRFSMSLMAMIDRNTSNPIYPSPTTGLITVPGSRACSVLP